MRNSIIYKKGFIINDKFYRLIHSSFQGCVYKRCALYNTCSIKVNGHVYIGRKLCAMLFTKLNLQIDSNILANMYKIVETHKFDEGTQTTFDCSPDLKQELTLLSSITSNGIKYINLTPQNCYNCHFCKEKKDTSLRLQKICSLQLIYFEEEHAPHQRYLKGKSFLIIDDIDNAMEQCPLNYFRKLKNE